MRGPSLWGEVASGAPLVSQGRPNWPPLLCRPAWSCTWYICGITSSCTHPVVCEEAGWVPGHVPLCKFVLSLAGSPNQRILRGSARIGVWGPSFWPALQVGHGSVFGAFWCIAITLWSIHFNKKRSNPCFWVVAKSRYSLLISVRNSWPQSVWSTTQVISYFSGWIPLPTLTIWRSFHIARWLTLPFCIDKECSSDFN